MPALVDALGATGVKSGVVHGEDCAARANDAKQGANQCLGREALEQRAPQQSTPGDARPGDATTGGQADGCVAKRDRRRDGEERGDAPPPALYLVAKLPAPGTVAQVPPQRGAAKGGTTHVRELIANLIAVGIACGAVGEERFARLEDEGLHLVLRHSDHRADLIVGERPHLREDERRALIVGQVVDIGDQVAEILPAFDLERETVGRALLELEGRALPAGTEDGQAAVTSDGEQPGLQADRFRRGDEIAVGGEKRVLYGVLGFVGAAEHVPAEREDRPVVTVIDRLKGIRVPIPDHRHQAVIRQHPQHPRGRQHCEPCRRHPRHRPCFHGAHYALFRT